MHGYNDYFREIDTNTWIFSTDDESSPSNGIVYKRFNFQSVKGVYLRRDGFRSGPYLVIQENVYYTVNNQGGDFRFPGGYVS